MDSSHYNKIIRLVSEEKERVKIDYVMNAVFPGINKAVPDPWYDDISAFEKVFHLLDTACESIAQKITGKTSNP